MGLDSVIEELRRASESSSKSGKKKPRTPENMQNALLRAIADTTTLSGAIGSVDAALQLGQFLASDDDFQRNVNGIVADLLRLFPEQK